MAEKKKMGRPADDPKPYKVDARLNEEDFRTLEDYCQRKGIKRPEGIRDGIGSLNTKNEEAARTGKLPLPSNTQPPSREGNVLGKREVMGLA